MVYVFTLTEQTFSWKVPAGVFLFLISKAYSRCFMAPECHSPCRPATGMPDERCYGVLFRVGYGDANIMLLFEVSSIKDNQRPPLLWVALRCTIGDWVIFVTLYFTFFSKAKAVQIHLLAD